MKILQVITSLEIGGAETLVVNLIPRLCALGHTVDLCIFNGAETPLIHRRRYMHWGIVYTIHFI